MLVFIIGITELNVSVRAAIGKLYSGTTIAQAVAILAALIRGYIIIIINNINIILYYFILYNLCFIIKLIILCFIYNNKYNEIINL